MLVKKILENFENTLLLISGTELADISSIEYDSRKVKSGSLFVAVEGLEIDGHKYIENAVKSGAVAVIVSSGRSKDFTSIDAAVIEAADTRIALSYVSEFFYNMVSRKIPVIGVTGTNGKTSITYMLEAVFSEAKYKPGIIGTVNYRWGNKVIAAPNTTPESRDIHSLMNDMYNDGVDVIIMEVSSHGLSLGRVDHINFQGAIFTNLTRDHLDYHKTFEDYYSAKKKLFDLLNISKRENKFALINIDDSYGQQLFTELAARDNNYRISTTGVSENADYRISEFTATIKGIDYIIEKDSRKISVVLKMAGKFSMYNSICAFAAAHLFGLDEDKILRGLFLLKNVPGRFERISSTTGFDVVVDYAHTNDALEKLLSSVKDLFPEKLITVFGCGGDRDKSKRPLMGEIAVRYSDLAIITSDNPRTETPELIVEDIIAGIPDKQNNYYVEIDREKAIARAISEACKNSIVVIAGKGHEDYQITGKEKRHFDDKEIAAKYIQIREGQNDC